MASAGDTNGDGYADLVVGAFLYDGAATDGGAAFGYLGSRAGPASAEDWSVEGTATTASLGQSVGSAGDVDADGFDDVVIGAPNDDGAVLNAGSAMLFLGTPTGPAASAAWRVEGAQIGGSFGVAVAGAGDVDGDGRADVVVGASGEDTFRRDEGRVWLFLGATP